MAELRLPVTITPKIAAYAKTHGIEANSITGIFIRYKKPDGGRSPTYRCWCSMLQRVKNPKNNSYKNYGARGIGVDPRWLKYANFLADMGERPSGLTLERLNNDKGYWPNNCVWADKVTQNRNRRDVTLTYAIAEEIRFMYTKGHSHKDLAAQYNTSLGNVYAVIAKRIWKQP